MSRHVVSAAVAITLLLPSAVAARTQHSSRPPALVGEVRLIRIGLGVQPPQKKLRSAHIREALYSGYRAATGRQQQASLLFRDRSQLEMDQQTDVTLRNPHLTYLKRGNLHEVVSPGTAHSVQTASSVAAAVGSDFLVNVTKSGTLVATREGSVLVSNQFGYVYVEGGQATRVVAGHAPQQPFSYNVAGALSWQGKLTSGAPALDINLALAGNGGHVIAASSETQQTSTQRAGSAAYAIDGRLDRGWATAIGQPSNQWIKVGFTTSKMYSISGVVIGSGPLGEHDPRQSLQTFSVLVSTTDTADSSFSTVYTGKMKREAALQRFVLPAPVSARYVELHVGTNYGDPQQTVVTELEAIGHTGKGGTLQTSGECVFIHACMQRLLTLLNQDRASHHVAPLQLSETLSTGDGGCVGAYGHTLAMAQSGVLWHSKAKYPQASYPRDVCAHTKSPAENVGLQPPSDPIQSLTAINKLWMSDLRPGQKCTGDVHACTIISSRFHHVGIGIYLDAHGTWATTIFTS